MRALAAAVLAAVGLTFSPGGAVNPCSLVTAADASKAVGRAVVTSRPGIVAGFSTCVYTAGADKVTVKTRAISHVRYAAELKALPGALLNASDIGPDAWVFFVKNGVALEDWNGGMELGIAVVGAGPGANLIVARLGKVASGRL
jgi:hypothetical protein